MASSKQFGTVPANAEQQPEPFEVKFPEKKLEDLKTLLRLSPVAKDTYENHQDDRRFGVTREWMLDAKKYWEEKFDWYFILFSTHPAEHSSSRPSNLLLTSLPGASTKLT